MKTTAQELENATREAGKATPGWLAAEMPPGYQTRLAEIERLSRDLDTMGRFGGLLWQAGPALHHIVREAFAAFKFETGPVPDGDASSLVVTINNNRHLLLHVSSSQSPIQKKGDDLAQVFRLVHETAEEGDRVVLVANTDPASPPASRPEGVEAEALNLLRRLGANFVSGPTLFSLWKLSLQAPDRTRAHIERLHDQDGGVFALPRTEKI